LKDLLKNTPEEHPEYEDLKESHDSIVEIATYCNKKKAEALNVFKVVELAEELKIKDLVQPGRRIVKEGELRRAKSRKVARLYLFNDLMVIVEKGLLNKVIQIPLASSSGNEALIVNTIDSYDSPSTETDPNDCRMEMKAVEFGYQRNFVCESKEDRDEWMKLIEATQKVALTGYNSDSRSPKKRRGTLTIPTKGFIQIFSP
jgi:hypothetical protein